MKEWKIEVTVILPDDVRESDIDLLLSDAIGEFRSARGPTAELYVERRYPAAEYPSVDRAKKIQQVEERRGWARALREAINMRARYTVTRKDVGCAVCGSTDSPREGEGWACPDCGTV